MSDETPTPPPHEPPGHEPQGVVETLREELHEVVEHVPQPVRWTVGKLVRIFLVSLVLLLVLVVASAVLYLANRTELVAHEVTLVINQQLAVHSDVVLSMRDIKGNPFSGFRVVEPRVRFRGDGQPLLEAAEMRVGYSPWSLLRGGGRPVEVEIDHAWVHLDAGAGHRWRFPAWRSGPKLPGGRPRPLAFGITLKDARIVCPAPYGAVEGLDLRVSGSTGPATKVVLEHMRYASGPWHSRLDQLAAEYASDHDSVHVRVRELRTADLALQLAGAWAAGGHAQVVDADVERVRWRWLADVFDNDEFDVAGEGHLRAHATHQGRWLGTANADGSWDSLAVTAHTRFGWDGHELTLDSLAGQTLAGDVSRARLRWSREGWMLAGEATTADPSHWHALRLDGWPEGQLNGTFRYALDSRTKVNRSRLDVRLDPSQWVGWNVDSARVHVEFPGVADDSFQVRAFRRGGTFALDARVDARGWRGPYRIDEYPLDEWPDGRASGLRGTLVHGEGGVDSRKDGLHVTGDLVGAATDWSAAHFSRWTLHQVDGRLLPRPDLTAAVTARDGFFVGVHVDSADATLHLGDQVVAFSPLHASAGDTLFTATGDGSWAGSEWRVSMATAGAASSQFAWTAEPPLLFSGDARGTRFDRVIADDHDAHLEASGRWAAPGGDYDFAMTGTRLDLGRLGMPREWALSGHGDARLAVTGRPGDPRWTFDGRAARPGFQGHACDTLSVSLAGSPHTLEVHNLLYGLEGGTARAHGNVERTPNAFPDSLTGTAVVRWLEGAEAWSGAAEAKALPVSHLGAFAPQAEGWAGVLGGRLTIAGSPGQPELGLDAVADDFGFKEYRAQRVETRATYRAGLLEVPQALVTMEDVVSTVSGRIPVRLALGSDPVMPDAPMNWSVTVPRGDLKLLPALLPLIQSARGRFDLDATVEGTTRHPRVAGRAHIRDGVVRPAGREEVLESVYADLRFDESHITLDSLAARQGRLGQVRAKGAVQLKGFDFTTYGFDLDLRNFASSQEGLYAMLFDGDFRVVNGPPVRGERLPQVTGNVRIKRGVIEFDFANQSEVQKRMATTEPLFWTYRVNVDAARNLHWRPPNAGDIEFDADLDLEQTPDSLLAFGEMHLVKGYYFLVLPGGLIGPRFTVTQADLTFDNQQGLDPTLDVIADTKLKPGRVEPSRSAVGGTGSESEDITVHLTGRSTEPVPAFSSSPNDWDQNTIIQELSYGLFVGPGVAPADLLKSSITRQFSNQVSHDLSKVSGDAVNEWEIERDQGELFGGSGGYVVRVGGDLNSRMSWIYMQRLNGDYSYLLTGATNTLSDQDVTLEYRLNRFIYATTDVGKIRKIQTFGIIPPAVTDFNVNLKARWEY